MTTVLHSTRVWLPQTMTWLFTQVAHLPGAVEAHVACERTDNLDQFPVEHLHVMPPAGFLGRMVEKRWGGLRNARYGRHLARIAQRAGADVLHSHFGPVAWRDMAAARFAGLSHVVTFYGYDVIFVPRQQPVWRERYRELFAAVDRVLCEGPHMGQCIEALGCPAEKVCVHRLGIELDRFPYKPREWTGDGPFKVLIAGSFHEKKGIPYAIEALGRIKDEVALEVTVIGDAPDQPRAREEKARILAAIEAAGLTDRVRLAGYRPHRELIEAAYEHHLFLSPSITAADGDTEGGAPVALIEMAATGMAVVSTTHCDIPQVIRHGETGLLAEERDVDGLADHLRWFIRNPDRWRPMLDAGRAHMEAAFDATRQGEALAAIYRELAEPSE